MEHVGYTKTFGQFKDIEGSFCFDEQTLTLSDVHIVADADSVEPSTEPETVTCAVATFEHGRLPGDRVHWNLQRTDRRTYRFRNG